MHVSIMDTILVFSLLFIYYSLSPKDLRDYDCHVENSSEVLSERTRSMSILLQVFLVGLSNCIINAKLSEPEIFAEQLHATEVHRQNSSSGIGEDMLLRLTRRQSIYVKAVIICVLLPCSLAFIVFVIFEVPFPCPCPGWSQQCNCIQKCKRQGEERTENPNSASSEGSVMVGHKKRGASEQAPWSKAAKIIAIHET
ncbi:uncharacterized protein C17orf78 homolog isoform X7 [Mauremys mutica]|uniref:uncharacterized protein C17orf78 homolog isoform X7 n=1 Tax=Mauremys mutica TaxID=74926 RepID=UPI001D16AFA1|nr:uncharacterized protein C17orf78 homolog isoform X7 [Mauremys mutica]